MTTVHAHATRRAQHDNDRSCSYNTKSAGACPACTSRVTQRSCSAHTLTCTHAVRSRFLHVLFINTVGVMVVRMLFLPSPTTRPPPHPRSPTDSGTSRHGARPNELDVIFAFVRLNIPARSSSAAIAASPSFGGEGHSRPASLLPTPRLPRLLEMPCDQ